MQVSPRVIPPAPARSGPARRLSAGLGELAHRDEVVIATILGRMDRGPKGSGLSRAGIFTEVDASLRRLDIDYVDLYQSHRYDPTSPIEEAMEMPHGLVRAGKEHSGRASSMWAWQFEQVQYVADLHACAGRVLMIGL
jgi:aryl-alcohol dehydrogenase-like predicted oxidoreductase